MSKLFYPLAVPIFCLCYWYATPDEEFTVMGEFVTFASDYCSGDIPLNVAVAVYLKGIICTVLFPLIVLYKSIKP